MKYMGSKARIAKEIMSIILKDRKLGQTYWEPFCGGLNTMYEPILSPTIMSDSNPFLIDMWRAIVYHKSCSPIGTELPVNISKQEYDVARTMYNTLIKNNDRCNIVQSGKIGWIGFMASYNGRFFDGGYSGCSAGRDYVAETINNLIKQLPTIKLSSPTFMWGSYNEVYKRILRLELQGHWPQEMIIYCDPPYKNSKQYSGKSFDYDAFYQWCIDRHAEGHQVFISEYDMPTELGFKEIWSKEIKCNIHVEKSSRTEKLWTL